MEQHVSKQIMVSGLKPSGEIHLGNYLGAVKQWVELQDMHPSYFFVADLHAITEPQKPKDLHAQIIETAATYLALGIDPKKSVFFIQSHVPQHTELMWILNTITSMGDLERMVVYKEKISEGKEALAGLFAYPVLMAADIILYKAAHVPVGEDQRQHVELTRELARRFNTRFGNVFPLPKPLLPKVGARIMSLQDPSKKMSKSHGAATYIGLFDAPDVIRKKIKSAVTDSGSEIIYSPEKKPAVANLMTLYHLYSGLTFSEIEKEFAGKGYGDFKVALAELLISNLSPIQDERAAILADKNRLLTVLRDGGERASATAAKTLDEVYAKVGLKIEI
ncbi:MAG: tryptophan--tRNA ligase [Candidatus Ryanbacteria bacterium RIFCSPHIGHO2_02_FULL_48_12]|uniref:Tryptophan--tRNA ligase n=1 Tax=Candidatus Ryanbacteria bacterium RIFCSPHIGHO2_01_FULL_48_27 TaxID=1802115 RepID=A0A1G2G4N8_9BACT|nr:MAG: tryptophan--tRNA ligase [Candidatus Ryanbacteria bacterium RIFCSPHIGHO2_01_FULL_48_27]OGZ49007.1 MAG: tryptophan--tRNA ligase [Candidatus Ryanbacteria bacterium RIFCSPHIGHO2_02_FULL_48_12]